MNHSDCVGDGLPAAGRWVTGWIIVFGAVAVLSGCDKPFRVHETVSLTAPLPAETLTVRTDMGDIAVRGDAETAEILAEVQLIGRGSSLSEAKKALEEIQVSLTQNENEPGTVIAQADHPRNTMTREYRVHWKVTAPPHLSLTVCTKFGDVQAHGFEQGVDLHTDFGEVDAEAAGPVRVYSKFGDLDVRLRSRNPGDVSLVTKFGDVHLQMPAVRTGRLRAGTDFGSVKPHLDGLTMRLNKTREHSFDVDLGNADTPLLEALTDFGDVDIRVYQDD